MAASFFFYDLETSGFNPRSARIMQFAGQRTDLNLKPIGEPIDELIKLTPDSLPEPDAVLVTGITPQKTLSDGLTEYEFLKLFQEKVVRPDTIFVGFNNIRFDDEFMRFLLYRNFYDPYEWQWQDGCSRWDLLDVVRMIRALRPEGITWPFSSEGKPTNKLEFLTAVNKLAHDGAHTALADVRATISVAQLLLKQQPETFKYLLSHRDKKSVKQLVEKGLPFVYTSGHYSGEFFHTTVVSLLGKHLQQDAALVYDLRFDPSPFLKMSVEELAEAWKWSPDPDKLRLPVKTLKYNRSPAVAPLGVIKDEATRLRLQIDLKMIEKHRAMLQSQFKDFAEKVASVVQKLDEQRAAQQTSLVDNPLTADERLYDNFISDDDKIVERAVRAATPEELDGLADGLKDDRLRSLLPLYKARNFSASLSREERQQWEEFCSRKLFDGGKDSRLARYFNRLQELSEGKLTDNQRYLLEELQLYGESIMPADAAG